MKKTGEAPVGKAYPLMSDKSSRILEHALEDGQERLPHVAVALG
jgi:hypothetical protein